MNEKRILIVDDDPQSTTILRAAFAEVRVEADVVEDAFAAIRNLRERSYCAVILDPVIRRGLNGYTVLNFLEMEQPETLDRLFLLTGMSEQTIRRTAPSILPRLFRKPIGYSKLTAAVAAACAVNIIQPPKSNWKSVLLVEDDRATAHATARVLDGLGYSVEWARDGMEGLAILGTREFDAIMLDLVMPRLDGFAVLDRFRAESTLLRKTIVITGMPDKYLPDLDVSVLGGILRKPFGIPQLECLLRHCIQDRAVAFEPGGELP
jgi:DNA-binding response OmpR family regulator